MPAIATSELVRLVTWHGVRGTALRTGISSAEIEHRTGHRLRANRKIYDLRGGLSDSERHQLRAIALRLRDQWQQHARADELARRRPRTREEHEAIVWANFCDVLG